MADGARRIKFQQVNPKKGGSKSYHRYEIYKAATSEREFYRLGGSKEDLTHDLRKRFVEYTDAGETLVAQEPDADGGGGAATPAAPALPNSLVSRLTERITSVKLSHDRGDLIVCGGRATEDGGHIAAVVRLTAVHASTGAALERPLRFGDGIVVGDGFDVYAVVWGEVDSKYGAGKDAAGKSITTTTESVYLRCFGVTVTETRAGVKWTIDSKDWRRVAASAVVGIVELDPSLKDPQTSGSLMEAMEQPKAKGVAFCGAPTTVADVLEDFIAARERDLTCRVGVFGLTWPNHYYSPVCVGTSVGTSYRGKLANDLAVAADQMLLNDQFRTVIVDFECQIVDQIFRVDDS
jgi:hypothetical protein